MAQDCFVKISNRQQVQYITRTVQQNAQTKYKRQEGRRKHKCIPANALMHDSRPSKHNDMVAYIEIHNRNIINN